MDTNPEDTNRGRRPLASTAVAVAGLGTVLWLVLASGGTPAPAAPTGVDPPPSVRVAAVEGDDAVARASRFVQSLPPEGTAGYAIVLDLVDRKFGAGWVGPLVDYARWFSARPGGETVAIFARVFDADARVVQDPAELADNTTDRLTAAALHCDSFPLPADYVQQLDKGLAGRMLSERTHATIALIWADEHGCLPPAEAARLRRSAADVLEQSIRQEADVHDQFVEAVALLFQLGEGDRVEDAWVDAIRDTQRPDGGWVEDSSSGRSSGHTTALALWVLLEAGHPEASTTTWIRNP